MLKPGYLGLIKTYITFYKQSNCLAMLKPMCTGYLTLISKLTFYKQTNFLFTLRSKLIYL